MRHKPPEHEADPFSADEHARSHEPQCVTLVDVSTHDIPHRVEAPPPQPLPHDAPPASRCATQRGVGSRQITPQAPQFSTRSRLASHPSLALAVQWALPGWQAPPTVQDPATQRAASGTTPVSRVQSCPHRPQFRGSVWRSTHPVSQPAASLHPASAVASTPTSLGISPSSAPRSAVTRSPPPISTVVTSTASMAAPPSGSIPSLEAPSIGCTTASPTSLFPASIVGQTHTPNVPPTPQVWVPRCPATQGHATTSPGTHWLTGRGPEHEPSSRTRVQAVIAKSCRVKRCIADSITVRSGFVLLRTVPIRRYRRGRSHARSNTRCPLRRPPRLLCSRAPVRRRLFRRQGSRNRS
jgi:hypothetical protein